MEPTSSPLTVPPHALRLLRQMADFNLHPERGLHPSWLPPDWPVRHRVPGRWGPGGQAVLSDLLRLRDGDALAPEYDFDAPLRRLALIDGAGLRRLAAYCGFAVHRPAFKLRGVGAALRRQAERYDADAFRFVLERMPRLDQFAMNLGPLEARPRSAGRVIVDRGHRLLLATLGSEGEALLRRVRRKLPRRVSQGTSLELHPAQREQLSEVILLCIVPERLPQWDWLF
jgi:type III secretion protein K